MWLFITLKQLYSADKPVTEFYDNMKAYDLEKPITNNFNFHTRNVLTLFILKITKNISHTFSLFVLLLEKLDERLHDVEIMEE
jgi:hypothetical protein